MQIQTEPYLKAVERWPQAGNLIMAYQQAETMVVYQAYKPAIAASAVKHQKLGGSDFSYNRMSWIKPSFLWMMFRCGWASKENQERVIAIHLSKTAFEHILSQAVHSTFKSAYYTSNEDWQNQLATKEVRLQWDPDHDPFGNKVERRAIQLGMKGNALKTFGQKEIVLIEDITDFVHAQKQYVDRHQLELLQVPVENKYIISSQQLSERTGADNSQTATTCLPLMNHEKPATEDGPQTTG